MEMISVIIPAYNCAGEYGLARCLDSILKSSYPNLQIIIVDDGSVDATWDICCRYSNQFEKIEAYRQENTGVSVARANALKHARGKYLAFVDADDTVDEDYFSYLYSIVSNEKVDMVSTMFTEIVGNAPIPEKEEENAYEILSKEEAVRIYAEDGTPLMWNLCGKLLLTDIFRANHKPSGLGMGSDSMEIFEYLTHCNYVAVSRARKYNYFRVNANSITKARFNEKKLDLLKLYTSMVEKYDKMNIGLYETNLWKKRAYEYAITSFFSCYIYKIVNYDVYAKSLASYIRKHRKEAKELVGTCKKVKIQIEAISFLPEFYGKYIAYKNRG